jgi:hypothetical protein
LLWLLLPFFLCQEDARTLKAQFGPPWSARGRGVDIPHFPQGVLSVTFRFSEQEKLECDSGKVATKDQVEKALPLLGKRERDFYLAHAR